MTGREKVAVALWPALTGRILLDSDYEDVAWLDTLEIADAILASDWLAAHDAAIRAEALAPVAAQHVEAYPGAGWCAGCHDAARNEAWPCPTVAVIADPDAVAKHNAAIAAKALNDAADAWQHGQWADAPRRADRIEERIANGQHVTDWLRARTKGADHG